jgi:hypothetical protein
MASQRMTAVLSASWSGRRQSVAARSAANMAMPRRRTSTFFRQMAARVWVCGCRAGQRDHHVSLAGAGLGEVLGVAGELGPGFRERAISATKGRSGRVTGSSSPAMVKARYVPGITVRVASDSKAWSPWT